jgi:hypothetical protein
MGALLNVVLDEAPGVEGGFWHDRLGFVAYAFPTHQGSQPKTDVPATERGRIETLVRSSLGRTAQAVGLQRGTREAIVLVACPVATNTANLGAWTMARVPVAAGRAYDEVTRGLALLLVFAAGSGLWLSHSVYRWTSGFGRIEGALRSAGSGGPSVLGPSTTLPSRSPGTQSPEPLRTLCARAAPRRPYETLTGNPDFIVHSEAMRDVVKLIGRAAASDATVLITGETGSGKEEVARALHRYSSRAARQTGAVCCSTRLAT